jgi:PRC-barrel domain protein
MNDTAPTGKLDAAVPLGKLPNYRIAAGDPDVRGWEVLGSDGRKIGEVDDLLVDTHRLRACYLDVTLDPGLREESATPGEAVSAGPETETAASPDLSPPPNVHSDLVGLAPMIEETVVRATLSEEENRLTQEHHLGFNARHVLIPVGRARLDAEHDRILVEGLRSMDATTLPDYTGQTLDRDYELSLRRWFDEASVASPEEDFYAHHLYDEDRFYSPRRLGRDRASAESARAAGLEADAPPAGEQDRTVTGELDRAVGAPDRSGPRGEAEVPQEETVLPGRGRT